MAAPPLSCGFTAFELSSSPVSPPNRLFPSVPSPSSLFLSSLLRLPSSLSLSLEDVWNLCVRELSAGASE